MKREKPDKIQYQYFSGLTDGDGVFSFSLKSKEELGWNCTFKLGVSLRNARMLYYCRDLIGCGSVNLRAGANQAELRIRDKRLLQNVVLPLFKRYPLYTSKAFYFFRWEKALNLLQGGESKIEKHAALLSLRAQHPDTNYRAPAWDSGVPSKGWLSGFLEAEGSFFISDVGGCRGERLAHVFGCTCTDRIVLEWVRQRLAIPAQVLECQPSLGVASYYKLETKNFRALSRLAPLFRGHFHGRKGLEHRIWERTLKWRGQNQRLRKIRGLLRDLR